jgi:hypothetical protein
MRLTWAEPRAQTFQFEALVREPRLHAADQTPREGVTAEGVTTEVTDGKFPAVPPLVPMVRLEMK